MNYTEIAIKVLALSMTRTIKTRAQFWKDFNCETNIDEAISKIRGIDEIIEKLHQEFDDANATDSYGLCCAFDNSFPNINTVVPNSEKPYLLFYKGNIDLIQDLNKNVAVIGLIDPNADIETRETAIVKKLIENDLIIVSGLANGCDEIAHRTCVENQAKTIAILPSTLNKIYPASNRILAQKIVDGNGLLLSEYYEEPNNRYDATSRYIERDRLQALFSKSVIMIASYKQGEGDSGSRHAMKYAQNYGISRYVMYNANSDSENIRFGLNKEFVHKNNVPILLSNTIEVIAKLQNPRLVNRNNTKGEQLKIF